LAARPAEVLHGDRHAVERPPDAAGQEVGLRHARLVEDPLPVERDERVEARLEALGAGEQRPAELQRREGPGVEPRAELGDPGPGEIAHWFALGGGGGAPPSPRPAPGPPPS